MHVLMTADTVGGVWTYCIDLCGALIAQEIEVTLLTMGRALTAEQEAEVERLDLGLMATQLKLEWMEDPWLDVMKAGAMLGWMVKEVEPDVVHLNQFALSSLDPGTPKVVVAHSDVLSWWRAVKGTAAGREWDRYRAEVRAGLDAADAVVGPTGAYLAALEAEVGVLENTRVIYNGRDRRLYEMGPEGIPDASSVRAPASAWGGGVEREAFVLSAGRLWDEAKGVATLNAAAAGLAWPVRVAGEEGEDGAAGRHVEPLGRLSPTDLAGQMKRAGIYCLPAQYEPFGLSALEAAMSGCPLVLGDIPTLREVWGDAAEYVQPGDAAGLRETLDTLIRDPQRRHAMATAAGQRAERYTQGAMAERYVELYQVLIG